VCVVCGGGGGGGGATLCFKLTVNFSNISVDSVTMELNDYGLTKTDKRIPNSSASHQSESCAHHQVRGGAATQLHSFLTSTLDGSAWSVSRTDRFTPRESASEVVK